MIEESSSDPRVVTTPIRTSEHYLSSTSFDPADYEAVDCLDFNPPEPEWGEPPASYVARRELWLADFTRLGIHTSQSHCHHCGKYLRYAVVFHHAPTDQNVPIGRTCAQENMALSSKIEIQHKNAVARNEGRRARAALSKWLEENPEQGAVITELYSLSHGHLHPWGRNVAGDLYQKFWQYKGFSPKQWAFAGKIREMADRKLDWERGTEARRQAAEARAAQIPPLDCTQRITIQGVVKAQKVQESTFGYTEKCLVVLPTDQRVWVTDQGSELEDTVQLDCRLKPSPTDPLFYFGSRPTKWVVVNSIPQE